MKFRLLRLVVSFLLKRRHGSWIVLGGLFEFDPEWRQTSELVKIEGLREKLIQTRAEYLASLPVETAIEFIGGLPGGGKSMYSVKLILDELIHGHRTIVTNEALNLPRMQEYLDSLGHHVHVADRVYLMTKEEVYTFYLRRSHSLLLSKPPVGEVFMDWTPTQNDDTAAGGVFYLIAECHNFFHPDSVELGKMNPEHPMFQWASQHRKLKDICFFQTQSVENVHVKIRRLGQQFHYIRNQRRETFRGFRRGDGFERTTYLKQPKSETAEPIEVKQFRLDSKGVGSCYFTAGGVGISTKGVGDGGKQKKGLSMKWLWIGATACLFGLVFLMFVLPKMVLASAVDSTLGDAKKSVTQSVQKTPAQIRDDNSGLNKPTAAASAIAKSPSDTPQQSQALVSSPVSTSVRPGQREDISKLTVVGMSAGGGRFDILLSDGTVRSEDDGTVRRVGRHWVDFTDLGRLWMKESRTVTVPRPSSEKPARAKETTSGNGLLGEPVPTASVSPVISNALDSGAEATTSWVTDRYGVQRLRNAETFTGAMNANNTTPLQNSVRTGSGF